MNNLKVFDLKFNFSPQMTTDVSAAPEDHSRRSEPMKRNVRCDYHQQRAVTPCSFLENTPIPATHAKVKKDKFGERIATLQHMVSHYAKETPLCFREEEAPVQRYS
ncbi:hypothetical protein HanXRQr2_Chr05g0212731 [Helianthus annuus]|uniref:Uncharacterized protein n=1 Tax=Helianthus annuus TaxID=4232 RepID=A0A9K3NM48_HELAN|nr:hypothetical protein HanXRQr2_Chr05g0212731 [Helianthus annuus]KAJ0922606.1 hypothetical protein HanPSC8_Chr05g0205841 [Helianthus annuus]